MPTMDEFLELINNTTRLWTMKDGVVGMLFTSLLSDRSIFIPATGYLINSFSRQYGVDARLWTTGYVSEQSAYYVLISQDEQTFRHAGSRYYGMTIRAVRDD